MIIDGVLTGEIGPWDCPILLSLFGTSDPARRQELKSQMEQDRLPLSEFKQREREERKQQKEREKARKEAEKRARALAKGKGQQWEAANNSMFSNLYAGDGSIEGGESLEELIGQSSTFNPRDIGQVAENFGLSEADLAKMPMADRPAALRRLASGRSR